MREHTRERKKKKKMKERRREGNGSKKQLNNEMWNCNLKECVCYVTQHKGSIKCGRNKLHPKTGKFSFRFFSILYSVP